MTTDTFVRNSRKPIETALGRSLRGSEESALRALGREIDGKSFDRKEVLQQIRQIFSGSYELDRHVWSLVEKGLK